MENNGMILGRFEDLLNILDAKTRITVYEETGAGEQRIVYSNVPVYSLYSLCNANNDDRHGDYKVIGINMGISTTILIRKGR